MLASGLDVYQGLEERKALYKLFRQCLYNVWILCTNCFDTVYPLFRACQHRVQTLATHCLGTGHPIEL